MLKFVRLLRKHSQIVYILNYKSYGLRSNTGAPDGIRGLTKKYKGNMFKNLLLENYMYNTSVFEITIKAFLIMYIQNY